jgi:cobalt-zinc-cadmium efflux system outer membrane protein
MRSICVLWGALGLAFSTPASGAGDPIDLPARRPLGAELPAVEAPAAGAAEALPDGGEPDGVIALRDALAAALLRSPELASFAFELRAAEARVLQAGLRPNPELALELEDVGGRDELRGFREAQTTLQLSQLVELGGKRAARIAAASAGRALAGWDYEARRLDVFSDTALAFVDVLVAQERLALAEDRIGLAAKSVGAARARLDAGLAPEVEVTRGELERTRADVGRAQAQGALDTARQRLAAHWGGRQARFERATGELEALSPPPSLESLWVRAAENPDLARFESEAAEREAALRLARAQALPDLRIGPGVRRLEGPDETVLVVGASIPLPIFDRNQGAVAEAAVRRTKLAAERRGAEVRVAAELAAAQRALAAAYTAAEALRSRALPTADDSLRAVRDGYERGRFSQLEVLDAQRAHFDVRSDYLGALGEFHRSRALIERLIAAPLETSSQQRRMQP